MKFIDNQGITDPRVNLAIEEFVLKHLPLEEDSYLLFYINEPSIIIGKNQNTIEEINSDYVKANNIHVVRRLSGGGAVYHDTGNLNFSFITKDDGQSFHNFRKFTQPVIDTLRSLGVNADLTGRNDIQVGEQKISGNAQFSTRGRMFSHGTLLFNSEMEHVASALKVKPIKIESKGTKSIRSRVANISEFLAEPMTIEQFKDTILRHIFGMEPDQVPQYKLTEQDWETIHRISQERYQNWDWNYGSSPKFNVEHSKKFPAGIVDVRMDVEDGLIQRMKIYGDFFGVGEVSDIEARLQGVRYEEQAIREALADMDINHYLGNISAEDFIGLVMLNE
ncbi:lipoate--protein ligase [Paenibacillus thiaminolyticus]|uniref:lipoate--protein ligase n=1 Tax=Paenibacillus thiaminolyticus TaxID=49283 RepID=A0AAP9DTP7_PANTH|nr:lipoate--protein ligase [Paenibacillus thiaminolyticus]MCY9533574.1 lipoate--protein ligase [Paenibacillus thiaminolyticus]MCY9600796.1 lipoate--protein ligase [Paenibacillus thiaminolyticus]MCY9607624.1 lipoate--protein ligase [Paenibacillus thiaminolyticus]MCY9611424.1 lipoate--protein ligase [Paenibacillus thiaminolyticus]MCY9617305.1 lipoate--protein ligase [Paenibacillus thiaminolyticus]